MSINFDKVIDRTNTYCTQWDYVKDRFGQEGLLPFTISDMDFAVPSEIQKTLLTRMEHPVYGYSRWNHDEYKQAICQWYLRRFDHVISPDWVAYSPSVIYAISVLIEQNSQPGDSVLMFTPAYDGFYGCVEGSHCQLVSSPLCDDHGHYSIDRHDFEEKVSQCRVLLLCNPHNPVGKVWTQEELEYITSVCQRHQVFIISDDIHMDMCFERPYVPITSLCRERVAICTSASKAFNIPGLGGAYTLLPEAEQHRLYLQTLKHKHGLSSPSIFGMLATITAYRQCDAWLDELKTYLQKNLRCVEQYLQQHLPMLTMTQPQGLYFAWINFSALDIKAESLKSHMVKQGLAIMTGEVYGETAQHYLRLNIACPQSKVLEGLERLSRSIKEIECERYSLV